MQKVVPKGMNAIEYTTCHGVTLQYLAKGDLPKWKVWTALIML
jgi:hypothetical protein